MSSELATSGKAWVAWLAADAAVALGTMGDWGDATREEPVHAQQAIKNAAAIVEVAQELGRKGSAMRFMITPPRGGQ